MNAKRGHNAATAARAFAETTRQLTGRGARAVREERALHRRTMSFVDSNGRAIRLIVKGRTAGDWQGTIADGQPVRAAPDTFWVFVDLAVTPAEFYLVPDAWMRWDIHRVHSGYLARTGGQRVRSPASTHHAVELHRIERWRGRWDLLGLELTPAERTEVG